MKYSLEPRSLFQQLRASLSPWKRKKEEEEEEGEGKKRGEENFSSAVITGPSPLLNDSRVLSRDQFDLSLSPPPPLRLLTSRETTLVSESFCSAGWVGRVVHRRARGGKKCEEC